MKRLVYSDSLTLALVSMVANAVCLFPTVAHAQNSEWINFTSGNSALPGDIVWSLAADSQGNLWIGTSGGLTKLV